MFLFSSEYFLGVQEVSSYLSTGVKPSLVAGTRLDSLMRRRSKAWKAEFLLYMKVGFEDILPNYMYPVHE